MARTDAAPEQSRFANGPVAPINEGRLSAPPGTLRAYHRKVAIGMRTLLRHVRQSAIAGDAGFDEFTQLERRLLIEIRAGTVARSTDVIALSGRDKAQVSRAVRRLVERGLVIRETMRAPFRLSEAGVETAAALNAVVEQRNAALVAGLSAADIAEVSVLIGEITAAAIILLDQERMLTTEEPSETSSISLEPARQALLIPQLTTLFAYMQRSAALMIRRVANLAIFESLVLSTVGERGPLSAAALIASVERDHSQARRTVRRLTELGLVSPLAVPGKRGRMLQLTEEGRELRHKLEHEGLRRAIMLFGEIEPDRIERLLAVLERMTSNALARAGKEMASGSRPEN